MLDVGVVDSDVRDVVGEEGLRDIEQVDGVMRITRIALLFKFKAPEELIEKAERALNNFADRCPAYLSVKECIEVSWDAEIEKG